MRICFFGTPPPAVTALEAFLADPEVEVAAVVTNPDRPGGRGHALRPPPVKVTAAEAGIPVWQPEKPREVLGDLAALAVDACAVVAYGALLPPDLLDAGGRGFVNLHFSVLPAWRGAAPVQHAILAGARETGITCFVLDEGMDTGPILRVRRTPVEPGETAGELTARLAELGAPVLVDTIREFVAGRITPTPQDDGAATYAPKLSPQDARIDWTARADDVERVVRAFNPVPGAHTTYAGDRLKVHRAVAVPHGRQGQPPGAVLRADPEGPVVACGAGLLRLDEVQPAGKPRMTGDAFVNGYRPVGHVLGQLA